MRSFKSFWLKEQLGGSLHGEVVWVPWGENPWPVLCMPCPSPNPMLCSQSFRGRSCSRNRSHPFLWGQGSSCLLSPGWGLTFTLDSHLCVGSNPGCASFQP